jgi:hypothetical protein
MFVLHIVHSLLSKKGTLLLLQMVHMLTFTEWTRENVADQDYSTVTNRPVSSLSLSLGANELRRLAFSC